MIYPIYNSNFTYNHFQKKIIFLVYILINISASVVCCNYDGRVTFAFTLVLVLLLHIMTSCSALTKSIAYQLLRDFSITSFIGA